MKVAYQLGVAGYVETVRGRGGGLRLAKPLEAITLGEVVRRKEPDMALVLCFAPIDATCAIKPRCALRTALKRATTAFTDVFDEYTLKDLAKPRSSLRALLSIAPAPRADAPGGRSVGH
jgi:Rrf2 family transcriptional regulator, nitric oxide-sensitive transcriptional repressor